MIGASGSSSGVGPSWSFGLLGTNASRALIQDRSHSFELGDPINYMLFKVTPLVPEDELFFEYEGEKLEEKKAPRVGK